MPIRPAEPADIPAILAIWNPIIATSTAIFSSRQRSPAELAALLRDKAALNHPFLVHQTDEGGIAGFATYGRFRRSDGYDRTMEHSIMLAPSARGRGTGRALMAAIEAHARKAGIHSLIGGISATNRAGLAFHRALGYREIARLPEVGYKNGTWLDLILMQKLLNAPARDG